MNNILRLLFWGALLTGASNLNAHNVLGGVYTIGALVEGEVGFSNGVMANQGTQVSVTDNDGNTLFTLVTDDEGFFSFSAERRVDHHIRADLGQGHVFEATLYADDLPESLAPDDASNAALSSPQGVAASAESAANTKELESLVARAVARQVKPLRQDLLALKEKASLQDVLGGIGYIFGLCGIGILLRQRYLDKSEPSAKTGDLPANKRRGH